MDDEPEKSSRKNNAHVASYSRPFDFAESPFMRFSLRILLIVPALAGILLAGQRMLIPLFGFILTACVILSLLNVAGEYRDQAP